MTKRQAVRELIAKLQSSVEGATFAREIPGWGLGFTVQLEGKEFRVSVAAKRDAKAAK